MPTPILQMVLSGFIFKPTNNIMVFACFSASQSNLLIGSVSILLARPYKKQVIE